MSLERQTHLLRAVDGCNSSSRVGKIIIMSFTGCLWFTSHILRTDDKPVSNRQWTKTTVLPENYAAIIISHSNTSHVTCICALTLLHDSIGLCVFVCLGRLSPSSNLHVHTLFSLLADIGWCRGVCLRESCHIWRADGVPFLHHTVCLYVYLSLSQQMDPGEYWDA